MVLSTKSKLLQLFTVFFLLTVLTIPMMGATYFNNNAHASIKNPHEQPKKTNGHGNPLIEKPVLPPAIAEKKKGTAVGSQIPPTPARKIIYLTFDDGPEKFSGDLISLLDHYHAKATFFMLDGNIRKYPEAVKRMVKDGEGVGLHGVTHDRKKFYASVESVLGEMNQDRKTLKEVTGVESFLIRTPYGSAPDMKPAYKQAVYQNKYLMWD
ncbi:MAG: polysaccharide deacetylase family protein, partial [Bacillota bacterium]|nr:polysaccharide deacetylase family protein [Bacillota bacterium]